jgi:hypothetical protein
MVFNATSNNISVISWRSVLLGELPGEKSLTNLLHKVISSTHRHVFLIRKQ